VFIAFLLAALATAASAGELLKSPGNAASWDLNVTGEAAVKMTQSDGAFRFDVTRLDKEKWRAQFMQVLTGLRPGTPYTLKFSAKASTPRTFEIWCQHQGDSWAPATGYIPPAKLTTQWQQFTLPIVFENVNEKQEIRAPIFVLGTATGTFWLKDISFSDGSSPAQPTPTQVPVPTQSPQNLLHDPLNPASWSVLLHSGAKATLSRSDEDLKLVVERPGTADWHVEFFQATTDFRTPGKYTLEVAMRADRPRKVPFAVLLNASPYTPLVPATDINVGTEMKRYKIQFRLDKIPNGELRAPQFTFGASAGTIWLRPISLTGPANAAQ
jgi:hypothetical protein